MTITLDTDDDVSEQLAAQAADADERDLLISMAIWDAALTRRYAKLDSHAAAGIARLRARSCDRAGDLLGSVAFRLHAQRHYARAYMHDQQPKTLADIAESEAA